MKKILTIASVMIALSAIAADLAVTVTSSSTVPAGMSVVTTNRASVYSIDVTPVTPLAGAFVAGLFDSDGTNVTTGWGTNYITTSNLVSVLQFTTNIASSWVDPYYNTNWYTNKCIYTLYTTNTSIYTNQLKPLVLLSAAGGLTTTFDIDAVFAKGIVITNNTNATLVFHYRTGK